MAKERPIGVTVVSILEVLIGLAWLLYYSLKLGQEIYKAFPNRDYVLEVLTLDSLAPIAVFFLVFWTGMKTFSLEKSGWQLQFVLSFLIVGFYVYTAFLRIGDMAEMGYENIRFFPWILGFVMLIVPLGLFLFYLTQPRVRDQFEWVQHPTRS